MQTIQDKGIRNVSDNPVLLSQMMDDMEKASELFKPTNYWKFYEDRFLPELNQRGLKDFRRRRGSVLYSFNATDFPLEPQFRFSRVFKGHHKLSLFLDRVVKKIPLLKLGLSEVDSHGVTEFCYNYVKNKLAAAGLDIRQCPLDRVGNPEETLELEGEPWSFRHLGFLSIFADVAKHVPLKPDMVLFELGAGLGRNVSIFSKFFPDATSFIFDIPPQLYVANQYLSSLFGDRVVPYEQAMKLAPLPDGSIPAELKGKIVVLPTWKFPEWKNSKPDLFFNSESFQEMEPAIVENYLSIVRQINPEYIYINSMMQGCGWQKTGASSGGNEKPVLESDYPPLLESQYQLLAWYPTDYLLRTRDYRSMIFQRQK